MKARDVTPMDRHTFCALYDLAMEGKLRSKQQQALVMEMARLRQTERLTVDALRAASSFVGGQDPREPDVLQTYQLVREAEARLSGDAPEVAAIHLTGYRVTTAESVSGVGPIIHLMESKPPFHLVHLFASEEEVKDAARFLERPVDVSVLLATPLRQVQQG